MSALKETFVSYSHSAEIFLSKTQSLILKMAELQHKLNFKPHKVSTANVSI